MKPLTRESKFNKIWSIAHKDFRGNLGGEKSLLSWAKFGGGLCTAKTISDAELDERYAEYVKRKMK